MQIIVYSSPKCHTCNQLKDWLNEKRVQFFVVDIFKNLNEGHRVIKATGQMSLPITELRGETSTYIVGFPKEHFIKQLQLKE